MKLRNLSLVPGVVLFGALSMGAVAGCYSGASTATESTGSDSGAVSGDDAGGDDAGDDSGDPYATPLQCTTNAHWTLGDRGSNRMHPGVDCMTCHASGGRAGQDKVFSIAGTVFPSAHEPDDCNGANGTGMNVVVVDANAKTFTIAVNSVGNFYLYAADGAPVTPFAAKVVKGTAARAMVAHQTTGACNSCHTTTGANDAPGRIMAP